MTAINFKAQFAPLVESGEKRQTIRRAGKRRPPKVGEELQLYTGQRTKQCRRIATGICTSVSRIAIDTRKNRICVANDEWKFLNNTQILKLAKAEGFPSAKEFFSFFYETNRAQEEDSFMGFIIKWELKK